MGWGDAIAKFFGSLAQPQQQAMPQAATQQSSSPMMPPMQQPSGVAGFLSNPLTQGALSSYLNYIGSPKVLGRGNALRNAGLGGLNAFNEAEFQQQQAPYRQAQLQAMQARIPQYQAQSGLAQARTSQISSIAAANKQTAATLRAMKPQLSIEQQQRADILANTIENDNSKVYDPKEVAVTLFTQPAQEAEIGARQKREEAETGLLPTKKAEIEAQTSKARAEEAAVPERVDIERARAERPAKTAAAKSTAPKPMEVERQILAEAKEAYKARPYSDFTETFDSFLSKYRAKRLPELTAEATVTSPEADIPEGAKGVYSVDGELIGFTHD